jgi:SAM-dependent methyltransferase
MELNIRTELTYRLARWLIARRQSRPHSDTEVASDWGAYGDWRALALRNQFDENFRGTALGKDALDFGCGDGALCSVLLGAGAKSAHGVDLDTKSLARFAERLTRMNGAKRPTFSRSESTSSIDEADRSFDAIYCLDVLEHISDYAPIIREWYRVLRPGGSVYIWWQPYWHPYGHHVYQWLPVPWAHAFLSSKEMTEVCARIVDWPEFKEPVFDRHPDGSRRNRFREPGADGDGFLNKLTVREFEGRCRGAGLTIKRRDFHPFTMPQPAKAISVALTKVPRVRDFFTACAIYELVKPT